jgi:hypothetical protein
MGRRMEMLHSEQDLGEMSNEEALAKLSEYAYDYPESRAELAETIETYAQRTKTDAEKYTAISTADEIRAIEMLEILCSEL